MPEFFFAEITEKIVNGLPAISHAIMAGREMESVDPNKMLSTKIVAEQKTTFGAVSEWL